MGFWNGKGVLVTGATGCAGSNLIKLLIDNGAKVRGLVRDLSILKNLEGLEEKIELVKGDVNDAESLNKAMEDIEVVFHLAAIVPVIEARKDPVNTFRVNVLGTFNVGQAALDSKVKRFLHASSSHVYGNQPESNLPLSEKTIPNPGDAYSTSKYASEIILKPLIDKGLDAVITRGFGYFGPGQAEDFLTAKVITSVLRNQNPSLGSSGSTRDYSYIADIVEGYALAAEKGRTGEVYNICSGKEILIKDFVEKIIKACNSSLEPIWNVSLRSSDISRQYGDNSKARKELGWKPKFSLEEGLKLTVDWWRKRIIL